MKCWSQPGHVVDRVKLIMWHVSHVQLVVEECPPLRLSQFLHLHLSGWLSVEQDSQIQIDTCGCGDGSLFDVEAEVVEVVSSVLCCVGLKIVLSLHVGQILWECMWVVRNLSLQHSHVNSVSGLSRLTSPLPLLQYLHFHLSW